MIIRVRLFALLRETAGIAETRLELANDAMVEDAVALLCEQYPALSRFRERWVTAVAMTFVHGDHRLNDGDELALLPPVSGG